MYGDVTAGYLRKNDGTEIISLPFDDNIFEMVFVVPQRG